MSIADDNYSIKSEERAVYAGYAVAGYEDAMGRAAGDVSLEESIIDLLADLRHLCCIEGLSFEKALRLAETHFNAERG